MLERVASPPAPVRSKPVPVPASLPCQQAAYHSSVVDAYSDWQQSGFSSKTNKSGFTAEYTPSHRPLEAASHEQVPSRGLAMRVREPATGKPATDYTGSAASQRLQDQFVIGGNHKDNSSLEGASHRHEWRQRAGLDPVEGTSLDKLRRKISLPPAAAGGVQMDRRRDDQSGASRSTVGSSIGRHAQRLDRPHLSNEAARKRELAARERRGKGDVCDMSTKIARPQLDTETRAAT